MAWLFRRFLHLFFAPRGRQAAEHVRIESKKMAKDHGTEWIGIATPPWTSRADLAAYAKEKHTSIPLALDEDGAIFRAFGVRDIPVMVMLDARGRVSKVLSQP